MAESLYDSSLDAASPSENLRGTVLGSPESGAKGKKDYEVCEDPDAHRRHRRDALLFFLIAAILIPSLSFAILAATMGRDGTDRFGGLILMAGFFALMASPGYADWRLLFYRCPRCDRRLSRVTRVDEAAGIHQICPDCRIIWDLGFAWSFGGEGGGGGS